MVQLLITIWSFGARFFMWFVFSAWFLPSSVELGTGQHAHQNIQKKMGATKQPKMLNAMQDVENA